MLTVNITEEVELSPIMKDVYRRLRTNIEFTGVDNRVICITSCQSNDGKSSVSYHLARGFAEIGKKTLFIDADMRNSIFAEKNSIERGLTGLSHLLSGKAKLSEALYHTNYKNLFVIPCGRNPKNPTELLSKENFASTIQNLRDVFDYIIIDTPPLGLVVDAAQIAAQCDASMMVVAAGQNNRRAAKTTIAQLKQANPNFLGVILNKVSTDKRGYGKGYGYGYGYGYGGYGYGEKNEKE